MIEEIVLNSIEAKPFLEIIEERVYFSDIYKKVLGRESIDFDRIDYALKYGTDRNDESLIWKKSHEESIKKLGLKNSDVTYAAPLDSFIFEEENILFLPRYFYMFYDKNKIEPVKYKGKPISDDLFKPKKGYTFKDATILIARLEI